VGAISEVITVGWGKGVNVYYMFTSPLQLDGKTYPPRI
jgi:hypothetical protein